METFFEAVRSDPRLEAFRSSPYRHWILPVFALALLGLYAIWIAASPTSLLGQALSHSKDRGVVHVEGPRPVASASAPTDLGATQVAEEPPALLFRRLSAEEAGQVNAAMPLWKGPNAPSRPFLFSALDEPERAQAMQCMTEAVYYEAGFEPLPGAEAVAQVVINRVRHPAFPKTVCGVVFQGSEKPTGCQFSFTCDGARLKPAEPRAWARAKVVAERALNGFVMAQIGGATHYHADYVVPYWMPTMNKLTTIGRHIYYRWTWGQDRPEGVQSGSEIAAMSLVPPGAMTPVKTVSAPTLIVAQESEPYMRPRTEVVLADARSVAAQTEATDAAETGAAHGEIVETIVTKLEAPDLARFSSRPIPVAIPAALNVAPPCIGPTCGAWR